jgi:hypothetical protein
LAREPQPANQLRGSLGSVASTSEALAIYWSLRCVTFFLALTSFILLHILIQDDNESGGGNQSSSEFSSGVLSMKKCSYCGRVNYDFSSRCHECGVEFLKDFPSPPRGWLSLSPRSPEVANRAFAWPLIVACIVLLLCTFSEEFGHSAWGYGRSEVNRVLPVFGVLLGLLSICGSGLHKAFRIVALVVSALSLLAGLLPDVCE